MSNFRTGISTFGADPEGVAGHLAPLLEHARTHIPPSLQAETPVFLYATAGMRLLPTSQRNDVLDAACTFLKFHSNFRIDERSPEGPCGSSIRVITGEEEGLFGWIAVNYLMDQFTQDNNDRTTYGFLDMGGASTQIAFEPSLAERRPGDRLAEVRLRLVNGEEIRHQVFVTTWLGYGTNQARERYVDDTIRRQELGDVELSEPIPDPCLPRNLKLDENVDGATGGSRSLVGTGSFELCLKQVAPLLNKEAPCPDVPCLFNGVHVPNIDFSVSHFIGVSEYWYSSEHVFGLGGAYNFAEYERAASEFCSRDWDDILRQHRLSKDQGALGGDGELEADGKIIDLGKWGDVVEIPRLQMQCFKSAWLVNVLHDGIGMPRIVDPGGNPTDDAADVESKAKQKGLGKPLLQSLDVIRDTAISWTLGKMVLEASREVPPLSNDVVPISDPSLASNNASHTPHELPDGLGGDSNRDYQLEFTPGFASKIDLSLSSLLFLGVWLLVFVSLAYRLRRPISKLSRTLSRRFKSGALDDTNRTLLEEGEYPAGTPRYVGPSASQFLPSMRTILSRPLSLFRSSAQSSNTFTSRHMPLASSLMPFSRSFSSPSLRGMNGPGRSDQTPVNHIGSWTPQGSTPVRQDSVQTNGHSKQAIYQLPRSRNNSQMNLTMLVPRQMSSRSGSGQQTPTGGSFEDREYM